MSKNVSIVQKSKKALGRLMTGLSLLMMAPLAMAQDLASTSDQISNQLPAAVNLATRIGFALGVIFLVMAVLKFKSHNDDPRNTPLKTPMWLLGVSIMLISLPWVAKFGENTLGVQGNKNSVDGSVYSNL